PGANSFAAPTLSFAFNALLHARTTDLGVVAADTLCTPTAATMSAAAARGSRLISPQYSAERGLRPLRRAKRGTSPNPRLRAPGNRAACGRLGSRAHVPARRLRKAGRARPHGRVYPE